MRVDLVPFFLCGAKDRFYFCLPEEYVRRPLIRGSADILTGTRSRFDVLEGAGCGLWVLAGLTMLYQEYSKARIVEFVCVSWNCTAVHFSVSLMCFVWGVKLGN